MSTTQSGVPQVEVLRLKRSLTLWHLIIYGIIIIQPTAPMPSFGVISKEARGHVVTTILIVALSYGLVKTQGFRKSFADFEVPND